MQRYTFEILSRLTCNYLSLEPKEVSGIKGHFWEQFILPEMAKNKLLWSPGTGPISHNHHIVTFYDLVPFDAPHFVNPWFSRWYRFLLPKLAKNSIHLFAISEFTKSRLVELFNIPEDKISVTYCGVDDRFQPCNETEIHRVKNSLGITNRYILSLGTLEPRKNLVNLINAWEKIETKYPDITLVLAGAEGSSAVFSKMPEFKTPKKIKWLNYVADEYLPALYSGAEAFLYLSSYEGFGIPPLEAMATGTPVITGNLTALPEVVGDAGIMVNPFNLDEIINAIETIMTNDGLRNQLRQNGISKSKLFDWQDTTRIIEDTLKRFA